MDRFRAIAQIWNWLPGFRAVAETEHLPSAAERLHVHARRAVAHRSPTGRHAGP